jgi:hypothetical protein
MMMPTTDGQGTREKTINIQKVEAALAEIRAECDRILERFEPPHNFLPVNTHYRGRVPMETLSFRFGYCSALRQFLEGAYDDADD